MTRRWAVVLAVALSLPFGFVGGYLLHRWTNQFERMEFCIVLAEEAMKRSGEDRLALKTAARLLQDRIKECVETSR